MNITYLNIYGLESRLSWKKKRKAEPAKLRAIQQAIISPRRERHRVCWYNVPPQGINNMTRLSERADSQAQLWKGQKQKK